MKSTLNGLLLISIVSGTLAAGCQGGKSSAKDDDAVSPGETKAMSMALYFDLSKSKAATLDDEPDPLGMELFDPGQPFFIDFIDIGNLVFTTNILNVTNTATADALWLADAQPGSATSRTLGESGSVVRIDARVNAPASIGARGIVVAIRQNTSSVKTLTAAAAPASTNLAAAVSAHSNKAAAIFLAARDLIGKDATTPPVSLTDVEAAAAAYDSAANDPGKVAASLVAAAAEARTDLVAKGGTAEDFSKMVDASDTEAKKPETLDASVGACACAPGSLDEVRRRRDSGAAAAGSGASPTANAATESAVDTLTALMKGLPDAAAVEALGLAKLKSKLDSYPALSGPQKAKALELGSTLIRARVAKDPAAAALAFASPVGDSRNPISAIVGAIVVTAAKNLGFDIAALFNDDVVAKTLTDIKSGAITITAGILSGKERVGALTTVKTKILVDAGTVTQEQADRLRKLLEGQFTALANAVADPTNADDVATITSKAVNLSVDAVLPAAH